MARRFLRNRDRHKFKPSEVVTSGVILSRYVGTVRKAKRLGVPLYDQRGNVTHKFGKPFGIAKRYGLCTKCGRKGMYKIPGAREGYTILKCRYCGSKDTYSS